MHITLESDYAVRIVSCLARQGGRMDAKRIAEETGVTLRFSLKILRKLVTGGLVRSYKGTKGGYELEPDFRCSRSPDGSCCKFRRVYADISQLVRQRLSQVTFEEKN